MCIRSQIKVEKSVTDSDTRHNYIYEVEMVLFLDFDGFS
jgi:hypothetical protein